MIIVGVGHFTLKSYTPLELGLTEPSWDGMTFVAYQSYFHIMFIPVIPVGKVMETHNQYGKSFPLTTQLKNHVDQLGLKHETPWYSFIGLFFGLAGLISIVSTILRK